MKFSEGRLQPDIRDSSSRYAYYNVVILTEPFAFHIGRHVVCKYVVNLYCSIEYTFSKLIGRRIPTVRMQ